MAVYVITKADKTALIALESVKSYLNVSGQDQDTALQSLIDRASAEFSRQVGRPLALQVYRERLRIDKPLPAINLSRGPVAAILSVSIDGKAWAGQLDECDVDRDTARIHCTAFLPHVNRLGCPCVVDVVYAAGYLLPDAQPPDIAAALLPLQPQSLPASVAGGCLTTVAMLRMSSDRDPLLKSESVQGVGNTSWGALNEASGAITSDALAALSGLSLAADWMA